MSLGLRFVGWFPVGFSWLVACQHHRWSRYESVPCMILCVYSGPRPQPKVRAPSSGVHLPTVDGTTRSAETETMGVTGRGLSNVPAAFTCSSHDPHASSTLSFGKFFSLALAVLRHAVAPPSIRPRRLCPSSRSLICATALACSSLLILVL